MTPWTLWIWRIFILNYVDYSHSSQITVVLQDHYKKRKGKLWKLKRKHAWQTPVWSRGNFRWESVTWGEKICSSSGKSGVVTLASLIIADSWAINVTFRLKFGLKGVCTSNTVDLTTQMQIEKTKKKPHYQDPHIYTFLHEQSLHFSK